jgi:hypothetical protein
MTVTLPTSGNRMICSWRCPRAIFYLVLLVLLWNNLTS